MKAKLEDGRIVGLEKDCACLVHDGPHWLYMDALVKRMNRQYRGRALAAVEAARLREKGWQMRSRGIVEILEVGRA